MANCHRDLASRHEAHPTDEGPFRVCQLSPHVSFMSLVDYFPGVPFTKLDKFLLVQESMPSKVHEQGTIRLLQQIWAALRELHPKLRRYEPVISNSDKMNSMSCPALCLK